MIQVASNIVLNEDELQFSFIRAPGPGGQNVNKVATAVLLRFNLMTSPSLSDDVRSRLVALFGNKMTAQGDLIIKATRFRTQERNKQDAINRLVDMLRRGAVAPKKRKKTKPSFSSMERRLSSKKIHSKNKSLRRMKLNDD